MYDVIGKTSFYFEEFWPLFSTKAIHSEFLEILRDNSAKLLSDKILAVSHTIFWVKVPQVCKSPASVWDWLVKGHKGGVLTTWYTYDFNFSPGYLTI